MTTNDTLSIALPLALALIAAGMALFWVVRPLLAPHAPPPPPEDDRLAALQARKEATLAAIRDLNFDYTLGKLTQEDFARHEARLRRQAIILMQQIDQLAPASAASASVSIDLVEGLEEEITSHRNIANSQSGIQANI